MTVVDAAGGERVVARLDGHGPALAERARRLRSVLPPRPGGSVALLAAGLDVVVVAHTGLEPLATIPDAWSGRIVGAEVRVAFTRFAASSLPDTDDGRVDWLFERWREVDDWIGS